MRTKRMVYWQAAAGVGEGPVAGGGQRVAERRRVQVGKARVAEPSPDAGAAVDRALRHRSAGLSAQLACDADLRAAGTITALGVHDPRHGHVAPRMRP
jgi:hypothetical protein